MLALALSLPLLLQLTLTTPSYALQCYNCSNIADVNECLTITECRAGQSCYMDRTASGQTSTLGCTDNLQCGVIGGAGGTLVGRDLMERQTSDCHECCSTDKCNKNLCVHLKRKYVALYVISLLLIHHGGMIDYPGGQDINIIY
ncbi:uncharacterized protein LOC128557895 [Mercenaria mercenaria]|uniref:uncharacterized protein LOC128557895 n=1 Tax=Mercenaria mercenaria TaxID=6596 RepID=UPI00234E3A65|nr:uncharacterized protein LOC128557895 [Mercenaria mercenaria]